MTLLHLWHALVYLGDGAVLLPCAALVFAWLMAAPASRSTAWRWLLAVLLVAGGTAFGKTLYMVYGWHPAGWNFIGPSGHAALSFLVFPSAGALAIRRGRAGLRVVMLVLAACLAFAISFSSWVLGDHSLSEVVLGGVWGALGATVFLAASWRHGLQARWPRQWMVASLLLCVLVAYRQELPSERVLGWVAARLSGSATVHTRNDLGPQAQLSRKQPDTWAPGPPSAHARRQEKQ